MGKISAGAAKICITPPSEMMPAYFHGKMIFEGIYEDIYLRALVFDNGDRRMAFLSYESGDMARMEELRSAVKRECGLDPENVCFSAVHNHEAPTFANTHKGVKNIPEKLDWVMRYGDFIIRQTVLCVNEAISRMKPARYCVSTGKSFINANRDQLFENGLWGQGRDFEGPSDKELAVLRFTGYDGKIIGALVNYAVHGTACYQGMDEKQEKYLIAGDLPGMISNYLEERYRDDGAVFLWTSGAAANQNPIFFSSYQKYEHDKSHSLQYSVGYGVWTLCRHLAETQAVDDVGLVETVLDLTGLSLVDSLGDIGGNRACLRAGHKTSGAENLTETADETHHVRSSDGDIEIHKALALDSCNKILCTDNLCACGGCGLGICALCEDGYADILAGTVRKNDSASDLLVGVAGVNTQADVDFDSLIELCRCSLNGYVKSLVGLIKGGSVNELGALVVFLTVFHYSFLPIMWLNRILPPTGSINQQL